MPTDLPDDAPLETLADEAVDFAVSHHKGAGRSKQQKIARLYIKLRLNPEKRTAANLGALFGEDRRRIPEIEAASLAKLKREIRQRYPDLYPDAH